uniref:Uncharacterized protein n=1 Tax=Rhipicephalus microplus TaxID=6941 RepID=A0A6G5AI52_RHIMP
MTSAECRPHFIIVRSLACQAFSCSKRDVYIKKFVLLFLVPFKVRCRLHKMHSLPLTVIIVVTQNRFYTCPTDSLFGVMEYIILRFFLHLSHVRLVLLLLKLNNRSGCSEMKFSSEHVLLF